MIKAEVKGDINGIWIYIRNEANDLLCSYSVLEEELKPIRDAINKYIGE